MMVGVFPSNFKEVLIFPESDIRMFEEKSLKVTISLPRAHRKKRRRRRKKPDFPLLFLLLKVAAAERMPFPATVP